MLQRTTQLSLENLFVWSALGGTRTNLQPLRERIIPKVSVHSHFFHRIELMYASALPDAQSIRQSISAAQSRGVFTSI